MKTDLHRNNLSVTWRTYESYGTAIVNDRNSYRVRIPPMSQSEWESLIQMLYAYGQISYDTFCDLLMKRSEEGVDI